MWPFNKKVKTVNPFLEGAFEGMIDCHSHILWALDDGVKSLEEAQAVISLLHSIGIKKLIFTPHIMEDYPLNCASFLTQRFDEAKESLGSDLAPNISLAAEYMIDSAFTQRLKEPLLALNDKCLLVETSYLAPPIGLIQILSDLRLRGLRPVLAHPERYQYMTTSMYQEIKRAGILFQLNLMSLFGAYHTGCYNKAIALLEAGFYDLIGTDIHHLSPLNRLIQDAKLPIEYLPHIQRLVKNNQEILDF